MARARNIKPGFFRNADLAELPIEARLLFIGLWTIADREGRMEDRPKQIKMELFPADSLDCDALLDQLAAIGVIERYSCGGKRYLHVVNFCKHQNPHKDEKASTIPDKSGNVAEIKQAPKKHRASTVQAPCNDEESTVAIGLIPDSLIPDSLNHSEANASAGEPAKVTDPDEIIFGYGVPLLTNAGTPEKQARSFLGGLRKQHGDSALIDKLRDCIKAKPLQPLEWLGAALPPKARASPGRRPSAENFAEKDYGTGGMI